jgi:hypothetical protein
VSVARFFKFGVIVTGKGEAAFLPTFMRSLTVGGTCQFRVLRFTGQRMARTSAKRELRVVGTGLAIPDRDAEEIGLPARRHLQGDEAALVLVVDDLEHDRRGDRRAVFRRYREALDGVLGPHYTRASVHFLVNMLEAYYFADARAVREVLGIELDDHAGDVEELRHPKNALKKLAPGFDEVRDGGAIVGRLDLEHVLADPSTCGSLRALFAWCSKKIGQSPGARFCLTTGALDVVTGPQLGDELRSLADRRASPQ